MFLRGTWLPDSLQIYGACVEDAGEVMGHADPIALVALRKCTLLVLKATYKPLTMTAWLHTLSWGCPGTKASWCC